MGTIINSSVIANCIFFSHTAVCLRKENFLMLNEVHFLKVAHNEAESFSICIQYTYTVREILVDSVVMC